MGGGSKGGATKGGGPQGGGPKISFFSSLSCWSISLNFGGVWSAGALK